MNNTNMSNYRLAWNEFSESGSFADVKVHYDYDILTDWYNHTLKLQAASMINAKKTKDWYFYMKILAEFASQILQERYDIQYAEDPNFRYFEDLAELEAINYQTNS